MKTMNMPVDKFAVASEALASEATAPAIAVAIADTIRAVDHSILSIGFALVRIKTEKLHRDLGYRFMSAYIQHLIELKKLRGGF